MSGCNGKAILDAQPDMSLEDVRARMKPYQDRVDELLRRYFIKQGALLQVLWLVQEEFRWVPRIAIKWAAEQCEVSPVHAFGVVEFYTMYKQAPIGRYLIQVCHNVNCHVKGAEDLITHIEEKLGIHNGETTDDGLFTLLRVECLAMCGNAPGILINDEMLYGPGDLNELEEGWGPTVADVDRWIERLTAEAAEQPEAPQIDSLGGILLNTAGHPNSAGATGEVNAAGYAPAPPVLQVKAESKGEDISVTGLCAPEATKAICERSDDGQSWRVIGEVDVAAARSLPGPPGGPKPITIEDKLTIGAQAHYRWQCFEGDRQARLSVSADVTAVELPPEEEAEEEAS